jgi:hypothetical protein
MFPDPEEVNADGSLTPESLDHLVFDELVLAFMVIRLEIGAKPQFKNNLLHVHEEFFAGLTDALDKFKDVIPPQSFFEAVGSYENALDFGASITDQLVSCYNAFSSRLDNSGPITATYAGES